MHEYPRFLPLLGGGEDETPNCRNFLAIWMITEQKRALYLPQRMPHVLLYLRKKRTKTGSGVRLPAEARGYARWTKASEW